MAEVTFKSFAGLRNDVSTERLADGDLVAAVNVDLDDSGRLSRRAGYSKALAGSGVHSLWSDGRICLFVDGGALKRLHPGYAATVLQSGVGARPMSYVSVNGRVYYSNGEQVGVVDEFGSVRTWGLSPPALPLAAQAGGSLPAGDYQFVLTYVREDGQESGAGLAGLITVATGGIAFSDMPVSDDPAVSHKILYLTPQDGDVLYRAAVLTNDQTSYTYSGGALSLPLATQYLEPAPVGEIVAYHYGVLYVVQGPNVFHSAPFGYELFDPRDYFAFDSPVQIFAPVEGGIWVGTQKEISWLPGADPAEMKKQTRAATGSVMGTLAYAHVADLPDTKKVQLEELVALWWSDDGVCAGYPDGALIKLTQERYSPGIAGERGVGLVRKAGSGMQYLAVIHH